MKKLLLFFLICFLFFGCRKDVITLGNAVYPAPPPQKLNLVSIPYQGGAKYFSPGDVMLDYDSVSQVLDVSGTDSSFLYPGTYSCIKGAKQFKRHNPRTGLYYYITRSVWDFPNINRTYIVQFEDSFKLQLFIDPFEGMADDEIYYNFEMM